MLETIVRAGRLLVKAARSARGRAVVVVLAAAVLVGPATDEVIAEVDGALLQEIIQQRHLTPQQAAALSAIFMRYLPLWRTSQANAQHPVSEEQCVAEVLNRGLLPRRPRDEQICGHPYMVPIYRAGEPPAAAHACIDQFDFPGLPCHYPLTWVQARDAALMCDAMGERLCDAHEWEGACAGSLEPPNYIWGAPEVSRQIINRTREIIYAYGAQRRGDICGFGVAKSPHCDEANATGHGALTACGPNHFPNGYFYQCVSPFGVYDMHGNAAEHMNLPTRPEEMTSRGGTGVTEMKGSWFAFPRSVEPRVHPDDCRWRAPGWHRTAVMDPRSHQNYHLGFRCCSSR